MPSANLLKTALVLAAAISAFALSPACQSPERRKGQRTAPPGGFAPTGVRQTELQPGVAETRVPVENPFKDDPHALAEGRRLYNWYNCSGCHFNGGGGIGPPLMVEKWIYGSDPDQIFATIVEGRANGMPAYGGKIPAQQVWQIVAFVRSRRVEEQPAEASGSRRDALQGKASENVET